MGAIIDQTAGDLVTALINTNYQVTTTKIAFHINHADGQQTTAPMTDAIDRAVVEHQLAGTV